MFQLLAVGVGSFIGGCARYGLTKFFSRYPSFPYGTMLSNVIAGFLIGLIVGIERQSVKLTPNVKLFLTTGFLGGLSTFSTFSLESVVMFENGNYLKAGAYIILNIFLSMAAVCVGFLIVKLVKRFA